ncbi:ABC transporter permease [Pseudorhodoferax sp. Leaf265]|uniref:ABC transporter permease n=1 Tax=Pseudorhodoferax sp. Leaf265 TaxID=1736315 RepID=UPI0006FDA2A7|nr:ABC transporter permease [Pseudorhodoferax sp. Leaf265]KQP12917.1 ABC transporter permease [Pseudorhodoferax sp. Leaf265]
MSSPPLSAPAGMTVARAARALPRLATGGALRSVLRVALAVLAVGIVWEAAVVLLSIQAHYLPRLSLVLQAIAATPDAYWSGFLRTLSEALMGFSAGAVFGVGIGILFYRAPVLRDMVFPLFIVSQTIPVIAFGALVVLWFGNTMLAKAIIAFYVTFFPVTVNTLVGLRSVDPRQVALMRSFGATRGQLMRQLQFPTALPQIFVALRLGASLSLVGAIVGEWFGDTTGLGVLLLQAMFNENAVGLWAALLCCAVLGTLFYGVVAFIERRLVFWGAEQ